MRRLSDEAAMPPMTGAQIAAAVLVWLLVTVLLLGAVSREQHDDAPPAYTCAPGQPYTTKEC